MVILYGQCFYLILLPGIYKIMLAYSTQCATFPRRMCDMWSIKFSLSDTKLICVQRILTYQKPMYHLFYRGFYINCRSVNLHIENNPRKKIVVLNFHCLFHLWNLNSWRLQYGREPGIAGCNAVAVRSICRLDIYFWRCGRVHASLFVDHRHVNVFIHVLNFRGLKHKIILTVKFPDLQ